MAAQYLHIVSFNVPFPADYGGVIDIFYKIEALSQAGVRIILHCFEYGRVPSKELEDLCFKVYYYPRKRGIKQLLHSDPYIVASRNTNTVPKVLLKDSFPVLFEGLHSTSALIKCMEARKKTLVRAHNIEHEYYRLLARSEKVLLHKIHLRMEARKLKRYEPILQHADHILGIAKHETDYFRSTYGNAHFIPAFHRFKEVTSTPGMGDYILFHGNLGVAENSGMFLILLKKLLSRLPYPIVVAGKNPSEQFQRRLLPHKHIRLVADPSDREMDSLIENAQLNLLFTLQSTGIKLKLLHALFAGRHCLVSPQMVEGSGLENLCSVAASYQELEEQVHILMQQAFEEQQIRERKKALLDFSNRTGAEKIIRLLA